MEELVGDTDPSFAYAGGWDAVHGTYEGLSLAKSVTAYARTASAVSPSRCFAPRKSPLLLPWAVGLRPARAPPARQDPSPQISNPAPGASSASSRSTLRPGPQISQIAQAIIAELSRVGGTKVTLKLDIDAEAPADFPSDVVDVVNANAKTVKFEQSGFL
jgi:uncharacterized protein